MADFVIPEDLVREIGINAALAFITIREAVEKGETPSLSKLAFRCGVTAGGMMHIVERLEEAGMITVKRTDDRGHRNYYTVVK